VTWCRRWRAGLLRTPASRFPPVTRNVLRISQSAHVSSSKRETDAIAGILAGEPERPTRSDRSPCESLLRRVALAARAAHLPIIPTVVLTRIRFCRHPPLDADRVRAGIERVSTSSFTTAAGRSTTHHAI